MKPEPFAQPGALALEPRERFDSIDILRGLALFGVLAVNLVTEFRVSIFQQFLPAQGGMGWGDRWAEAFVRAALEMKAFALFSLLFGFGLALQYDRFAATVRPRYWLARRLGVLLAFGLVHLLLVWNGDILTEYALAGLLVLPLLAASARVVGVASVLLFAAYFAQPYLPPLVPWPEPAWIAHHVVQASQVLATGSYANVLTFNLNELPNLLPLHVYVLPRTLALFLLGAWIWKMGVIQQARALAGQFAAVAGVCLAGGVGASVLGAGSAAAVMLALGYAAAVIALLEYPPVRRLLRGFGAVGRMAFSNYIMQSLVAGWIFYGYGLGQFARLGAAPVLALAVAVYALQFWLSRWWLRHYRFGPLEWLWRTLTYGARQPMTIKRRNDDIKEPATLS